MIHVPTWLLFLAMFVATGGGFVVGLMCPFQLKIEKRGSDDDIGHR